MDGARLEKLSSCLRSLLSTLAPTPNPMVCSLPVSFPAEVEGLADFTHTGSPESCSSGGLLDLLREIQRMQGLLQKDEILMVKIQALCLIKG